MHTATVQEMLRHLPPSGQKLFLLDLSQGLQFKSLVKQRRPDTSVIRIGRHAADTLATATQLPLSANSVDAVSIYGMVTQTSAETRIFSEALRVLRPGGRFLALTPSLSNNPQHYANLLIDNGFARVLSEVLAAGIFFRGEKPYAAALSTAERIAVAATTTDAAEVLQGHQLTDVRGRYLHLLIKETPNVPVWRRSPDDMLTWHTPVFETPTHPQLVVAFTSLPKAVAFMQRAVLDGVVQDVNKIAKFRKDIAAEWPFSVLLNPDIDAVGTLQTVHDSELDPHTAESPDE
jgi:SAM-dependent methyltransferase